MTKIPLITGANRGIGLETARQLAQAGMTVLIGARDEARGETAAATALQLDVADDASIERAAERVTAGRDRLDVLVDNAGIDTPTAPSGTTRAVMRELFETNVFGMVAVTNAFLPLLRKSDSARIVNVSSEVASLGIITDPSSPMSRMQDLAYQSSKGALNWVTVMFAKELADSGIRVNAAVPGYVGTDLISNCGHSTTAEGASAGVALARLPDDGPTGTFWGTLTTNEPRLKTDAPW